MKVSEIRQAFPGIPEKDVRRLAKLFKDAAASSPKEIDAALETANGLIGGFGIEALQPEGAWVDKYWREAVALYVNMGDTYATTILYNTAQEEFLIGSWGDFLEAWEREQVEAAAEERETEEENAVSWKAEIKTAGDQDWVANAMRFSTKKSAENYVQNLTSRWTAVQEWRVVPSNDPVTEPL